jgi:hypothetical protein
VAAADRAEAVDLDRKGERPCPDRLDSFRSQPVWHPAEPVRRVLEGKAVGVAAQEEDRPGQCGHPVERLGGEGPRNDVAEYDDPVRTRQPRIGENGLERMAVAVDVRERSGRHLPPSVLPPAFRTLRTS